MEVGEIVSPLKGFQGTFDLLAHIPGDILLGGNFNGFEPPRVQTEPFGLIPQDSFNPFHHYLSPSLPLHPPPIVTVFALLITKAAYGNNPHVGELIIPKKSSKTKIFP
jgi:hypothetical protein